MADAAEVFARVDRRAGTRYAALVPNLRGLERALAAGADQVAVFAAASETFSRRNINQGIAESLDNYAAVCRVALDAGVPVRAYLSTAFGCPYEGPIARGPRGRAVRAAARAGGLRGGGQRHDRRGAPRAGVPPARRGRSPASACRPWPSTSTTRAGWRWRTSSRRSATASACFDASAGGLGGCPFAPGASGNLATDDLVYMLDGLGIATGVRLPVLLEASAFITARVNHELPSRVFQASRRALASPSEVTDADRG